MIRVIAKNWQGITMKNETFLDKQAATKFINERCFSHWYITTTTEKEVKE